MTTRQTCDGFTLIEMLVALIIVSMLSLAGYRGLNGMIQTRDHLTAETRKWQQLSLLFSRMEQDIALAIRRPVRDKDGNVQAPWVGHSVLRDIDDAELAFTRSGSPENSALLAPQRIAYRFENKAIVLLHWGSLDQAGNSAPERYPLLEGVSEFKLRYMDQIGNWYPQWPISNVGLELPAATEVSLTLTSGEHITRIFALQ
ncbi:MAG TPA: type II secretion system minor pseudopilin GspJ [Gallionellaceae bacterium]